MIMFIKLVRRLREKRLKLLLIGLKDRCVMRRVKNIVWGVMVVRRILFRRSGKSSLICLGKKIVKRGFSRLLRICQLNGK
jgi:hypothetical protein